MHSQRNIYLKMKPLQEARDILFQRFGSSGVMTGETVPVTEAVGRVLATAVTARLSSPNFHAAAMDGIAVKAEKTFGASETRPKELVIGRDAFYLNTGHVMPEGTDAVIMVEKLDRLDEHRVRIEAPAFPWQLVRKMGEDIVATQLLFSQNHQITPYCLGALISAGIFEVAVRRRPNVLIIPTGSEILDWRKRDTDRPAPGQVLESNSYVLGKLTEACGGAYTKHDCVRDDLEAIKTATRNGLQGGFDMVLIIGGSSAGSEDYARHAITALGSVHVHGVTMMPGKPVLIGEVDGKPVFGIPGYPVSAIIAFEQFVGPLIRRRLGLPDTAPQTAVVEPTRKIASKLGVEEFVRVKLGQVGGRIVATPLPRGAGCITSITEADGIIRIPNHVEGINAQQAVAAELLRPLPAIRNTIVIVGSHDNTLDVLADELRAGGGSGLSLSSSHVGSMGGLMAVKKGLCHLAGAHLLDTRDGSYNTSYIERYLPELYAAKKIRLVNLVFREQGLIVLPGNPKNINSIDDLAREDVTLINRQAGSGTRILLDYRLQESGLDPGRIQGYGIEEFTHMSVAVAVLSGTADAGLGICAAARALNLDFVPIVTERYDLVVPDTFFETRNFQVLLEIIRSSAFKKRVEALGGYGTARTGDILL
ncbi:MAG: molybdopterin biosynthesis protein [Desulfobacterales bacterium]